MISRPDLPRRGRVFEIAIVVSVAIHLLLGAIVAYDQPQVAKIMRQLAKQPKQEQTAALSTAITLERRTNPVVHPPPRPQPVPRVAVVPKVVPKTVPRSPEPVAKPTELAKIVPHARPQPKHAVVAQIQVPHANPNPQMNAQQLAEMEKAFAQTIAAARAANDPTRVDTTAPPMAMQHAHLDIAGVNELLRHGEGILTPREEFRANVDGDRNGKCYYVDYEINFNDGRFDSGPVYWPICYQRRTDPFWNNWKHFPLPPPQPGWQPTDAEWVVIAQHPLLRLYFPGRFPDAANGN